MSSRDHDDYVDDECDDCSVEGYSRYDKGGSGYDINDGDRYTKVKAGNCSENNCDKRKDVMLVGTLNVQLRYGARKAQSVGRWALDEGLDVVGLQEVGHPADAIHADVMKRYGYVMIAAAVPDPDDTHRDHLGVAILLKQRLMPRVIRTLRSLTGRLMGILLDVAGSVTLIISVYFPTGMEGCGDGEDKAQLAQELVNEINKWCAAPVRVAARVVAGRKAADRVLIMGDFNETRTSADRSTARLGLPAGLANRVASDAAEAAENKGEDDDEHDLVGVEESKTESGARRYHGRFTGQLIAAGFVDCYRAQHASGGFTCHSNRAEGKQAQSRVDYVWARGFDGVMASGAVVSARVVRAPVVSVHSAVIVALAGGWGALRAHPTVRPRLPNMSRATEEQRQRMCRAMSQYITAHQGVFDAIHPSVIGKSGSLRAAIECAGQELLTGAQLAVRHLPHSGGHRQPSGGSVRSASLTSVRLQRQQRSLSMLRSSIDRAVSHGPGGVQRFQAQIQRTLRCCSSLLDVSVVPPLTDSSVQDWRSAVHSALIRIRSEAQRSLRRDGSARRARLGSRGHGSQAIQDDWDANRKSAVEKMLRGDRTADIVSVIDPATESLVSEPDDIKRVLRVHFEQQLRCSGPRPEEHRVPVWVRRVYEPKAGILASY